MYTNFYLCAISKTLYREQCCTPLFTLSKEKTYKGAYKVSRRMKTYKFFKNLTILLFTWAQENFCANSQQNNNDIEHTFIPISHRCIEDEGREANKVFLIRSMKNAVYHLSLINREKISSILFLLILFHQCEMGISSINIYIYIYTIILTHINFGRFVYPLRQLSEIQNPLENLLTPFPY